MRANPNGKAADILPEAAVANSPVFYGADGQPRSVAQVYQHFAEKFDQDSANLPVSNPSPVLASTSVQPTPQSIPSATMAAAETDGRASPNLPLSGSMRPEIASLFASMILGQMDVADLSSTLAPDADESESEISVLA